MSSAPSAGRALGWHSPAVLVLLTAAVASLLGIVGYESRRRDPLLELRLFRSVPLSSAIVMAIFALCAFQAFLFVTTLYLQDVRGLSPLAAGVCLLPIGALVLMLSPVSGRIVAVHGPRRPLLIAGGALATGGAALQWLSPDTALPWVIAMYLLIGVFLGLVNPPITIRRQWTRAERPRVKLRSRSQLGRPPGSVADGGHQPRAESSILAPVWRFAHSSA